MTEYTSEWWDTSGIMYNIAVTKVQAGCAGTEEWLASKDLGLTVDKPFGAWKGEHYLLRN